MSCRICGRTDCTESFHSLQEQDEYIEINDKLVKKLDMGDDFEQLIDEHRHPERQ